jgi:hypothetical protein
MPPIFRQFHCSYADTPPCRLLFFHAAAATPLIIFDNILPLRQLSPHFHAFDFDFIYFFSCLSADDSYAFSIRHFQLSRRHYFAIDAFHFSHFIIFFAFIAA